MSTTAQTSYRGAIIWLQPAGTAISLSIYPQLSALEMLVYPKSAVAIANTILLGLETIEVIPPIGPLTLFI